VSAPKLLSPEKNRFGVFGFMQTRLYENSPILPLTVLKLDDDKKCRSAYQGRHV